MHKTKAENILSFLLTFNFNLRCVTTHEISLCKRLIFSSFLQVFVFPFSYHRLAVEEFNSDI